MPRRRESPQYEQSPRRRPATTPDERETQMIALADQLAERQLRDGTASAQVITHYLKLGSSRERLEQHRLELENQYTEAKMEALASQARVEQLYKTAMDAFRGYSGLPPLEDDSPEDPYE